MVENPDKLIFNKEDIDWFSSWLGLNIEEVTWQGKYEDEFKQFWQCFLIPDLSLAQIFERFEYAKEDVKIGPLYSWFSWIRDKFLCFAFIYKNVNLFEISQQTKLPLSEVSFIIRNFFNSKFPHLEDTFNDLFQVGNITSDNIFLNFKALSHEVGIDSNFKGSTDDEILTSLEVTLYQEWTKFFKKLKGENIFVHLDVNRLKSSNKNLKRRRFLVEVLLLFLVGGFLIYAVDFVNHWYEKSLAEKIGIFELDFLWLEEPLPIKSEEANTDEEFALNLKEIEELEKTENQKDTFVKEEVRFDPESEVILTSVDALPKDFGSAGLEQSEYEEIKKGGYRDKRYGDRMVYRVLMKSVDTDTSMGVLNGLLSQYEVTQRGNVRPGTKVPGGVYYNLFVPRSYLKEFLTSVMEIDESTLYENRSPGANPPGKNRVFVWIKQI